VANRSYTPPDAPLETYSRLLRTLGYERAVLVQPSVYGTDNRAMMDAIAAAGPGFRGVAVLDDAVGDAELARLHAGGVRGVRFNMLFKGGPSWAALDRLAARIAPLGWHVQFLIDVAATPDLDTLLARLPVPAVIDHVGHMPKDRGIADPGFRSLLRSVGSGRTWVKLTGAYRIADPPYAAVAPLARALIAANPERMLFGTDWPHPGHAGQMPNDGTLADLLADWAPGAETRRRILVDNPAALYGF
jgi:predicted TIM-barrel fold metal-dependent hydrolase